MADEGDRATVLLTWVDWSCGASFPSRIGERGYYVIGYTVRSTDRLRESQWRLHRKAVRSGKRGGPRVVLNRSFADPRKCGEPACNLGAGAWMPRRCGLSWVSGSPSPKTG